MGADGASIGPSAAIGPDFRSGSALTALQAPRTGRRGGDDRMVVDVALVVSQNSDRPFTPSQCKLRGTPAARAQREIPSRTKFRPLLRRTVFRLKEED